MKKHLVIIAAGFIIFISCGQSNGFKKRENKQDSIAEIDRIRKSADSLFSVFEKEKAKKDSLKKPDSIGKAGTEK